MRGSKTKSYNIVERHSDFRVLFLINVAMASDRVEQLFPHRYLNKQLKGKGVRQTSKVYRPSYIKACKQLDNILMMRGQ